MKFIKIIILTLLLSMVTLLTYSMNKPHAKYKVIKVKTKGDYYIIHAMRNDSLFKIISKKVVIKESEFELLKKGKSYYFDFGSNIDEKGTEPLAGIANYLDVKNKPVFIDGNTRIRFTKRFHYRLYTSNNLMGLYYIPPSPN
ncbi:hypothetical protein KMW28_07965 [Flammeovirga yaeyamensis]|uniref:Uncharacterized protein n=1 Tax=Flammeovirga yaeyamensis TaxID=367791 RepID=A0AAX1N7L6_9BACT|nr:hypothetical protein [Flammeovirga yaeyamensis]MBB3699098.1 hypothetical protein [Flammeovirga yaeyamensis]NMF36532.1 hypothetical protein [Flammeovirga yaeyamensis]QWG03510.1 hypothetical protein KMW28_07965 [Flammeovirga yaeyamensis]